ncbi:MAG TPA: hypothetical protein VF829_01825 [Candidatus Paceibacterota bacterium]
MNFDSLLHGIIVQIINPVILLLSGTAFIVFIWGVFQFVKNAGDESKRAEAQKSILWGIVGLVIIFGVYGILNVATSTFGLDRVEPITHQPGS